MLLMMMMMMMMWRKMMWRKMTAMKMAMVLSLYVMTVSRSMLRFPMLLTLLLTPVAYSLWDDLTVAMQRLPAWLGRGGSDGGQGTGKADPAAGPPSSRRYSSV